MRATSFKPSPAMIVAMVALVLGLGGTSYAAATLAKNSVGSKQIKNGQVRAKDLGKNAVTAAKVKDGTLRAADFAAGQLPAGAKGDTGVPGTPGVAGKDGTPAEAAWTANVSAGQIPDVPTVVDTLNLDQGSYVIHATGLVQATTAGTATCVLRHPGGGSNVGTARVSVGAGDRGMLAQTIAIKLTSPAIQNNNLDYECTDDGANMSLFQHRLTAVKVGALVEG